MSAPGTSGASTLDLAQNSDATAVAHELPTGARPAIASGWAWYSLLVLSIITLFAFVDRTIFPLLAEPIKLRLGLSDLQLGLLQGTGIAVFAGIASYPIGWLSDRYDRRWVLAGCIVVWSLAVLACGSTQTFEQLLLASAMVGAGEAGLAPIVFSMIPDLFPEQKRQLANSIFAVAAGAAGGLAYAISGQMVSHIEPLRPLLPAAMQSLDAWRLSFYAAAVPAPFMLLLIATVRFRSRKIMAESTTSGPAVPATHALRIVPYVREHRSTILYFLLGIGVAVFGFGAMGAWAVVIAMRVFGQTAAQVGAIITPVVLASTAISFALSVYVVRRFGPRYGDRLPVRALWISYVVAACGNVSLAFTATATQFYVVAGLGSTLTAAAGMLYPTALQSMAPAHLRARLISIQGIASLALGAAAAPAVGFLSDRLKDLPNGLLLAAVGVSVPALLIGFPSALPTPMPGPLQEARSS